MKNEKIEIRFQLVFILFWTESVIENIPALFWCIRHGHGISAWWHREVIDTYDNRRVIHKLNATPTIMHSTTRQLGEIILEQMECIDEWIQCTCDIEFPMKQQVAYSLADAYNTLDLFRVNIQRNHRMEITPQMRNEIRLTCKDAYKMFMAYVPIQKLQNN